MKRALRGAMQRSQDAGGVTVTAEVSDFLAAESYLLSYHQTIQSSRVVWRQVGQNPGVSAIHTTAWSVRLVGEW